VAQVERGTGPGTRDGTRDKLIRAAERLFAEHGIAGVPLRDINRAAGQSNRSAVQYYFGDRDGLVQAILARHRADDEVRRHALLDEYEQDANWGDLRGLVAAFVLPLVDKLDDDDGGREYLRIKAEHYSRPVPFDELFPERLPGHSMVRWHRLLNPLVPEEERALLHTRYPALRFVFFELARRAADTPRADDQLFAAHLIDLATAMLTSRPSEETRQLLERRRRRRKGRDRGSPSGGVDRRPRRSAGNGPR
jgi:AcrR family transcriptional regulator